VNDAGVILMMVVEPPDVVLVELEDDFDELLHADAAITAPTSRTVTTAR